MSSSHSYVGTGTTEDIYRGVINDVINGVRDYFLDENVDIEVLHQLRSAWEAKVKATGAADLDGHRSRAHLPPPPIRSSVSSGTSIVLNSERLRQLPTQLKSASANSMLVSSQSSRATPSSTSAAVVHSTSNIQYVQSSPSVVSAGGGNFITTIGGNQVMLPAGFRLAQIPAGGGINSVPGGIPATQYAVVQTGPGGQQQIIVIPSPGATATHSTNSLIPSHAQQVPVKVITSQQSTSGSGGVGGIQQQPFVVHRPRPVAAVKRELPQAQSQQQQQPANKRINQLDGKGVGMSDSSSSEDEMDEIDEEEDDPLNRFVSHLHEAGEPAEGSEIVEEEPLNSGDDQSDDEDAETLFESSNIVVCQFEKVHRARNKWKFILREGIIHIDGKDYCFQKSTGEAEF